MKKLNHQKLTKKQQRLLQKEEQEKKAFYSTRRKKIKKILFGFLLLALIISIITFALLNSSSPKDQSSAKIELSQNEYNAGTISMADGLVKHIYQIKNTGSSDLKIDRIWTSCMCTSAVLKVGDKISPKFGMHNNPIFWSQKIAPGKTGELEVAFDPAFHGAQGIGSIVRIIYLTTNDPQNKKVSVKFSAKVIQ